MSDQFVPCIELYANSNGPGVVRPIIPEVIQGSIYAIDLYRPTRHQAEGSDCDLAIAGAAG